MTTQTAMLSKVGIPGAIVALASCAATPSQAPEFRGHTIEAVGPMSGSRAAHTATPLGNDHVLIAGGFGSAGPSTRTTEIFDAATNRFVTGPSMTVARQSHTATVLQDGRILIAGGMDGGEYLASAELYDPRTNQFTAAGSMTAPRSGHQAVLLADGKVLLAGGVSTGWTFLASAEIYDPATNVFEATAPMSVARESHTMIALDDGTVLVVGGHRGRQSSIVLYASAELYSPATKQWSPTGSMAIRRHKHDAVRLPDGQVLITGGSDERDERGAYRSAELYSPATGRFTAVGSMVHARYKHQGTSLALPNGSVVIASGALEPEVFDPSTRTFAVLRSGVQMLGSFAASAPIGVDEVLVTGGYGRGSEPTARAWRLRVPARSEP
jgi:hypothetical protein